MAVVFLLEDDTFSALALSSLLEGEGYTVHSFSSSDLALESGARMVPDVLIADWSVDGAIPSADVARRLRRLNPAIRIIFVTGYESDEIRAEVRDLEPCSVLSKPLDFEGFLLMMRGTGEPRGGEWLHVEGLSRTA